MTEQLLQFIWCYQYFNRGELATTDGEVLTIVKPGTANRDQGPDFLDASLMLGSMRWNGSIELHLRTTDWRRHRHEADRNYANVILHVVWQHDARVNDRPVLELCSRVPGILLSRYQALMENQALIPCNANTRYITALGWLSWKDRLLFERLERKSAMISRISLSAGHHWPTTVWWMLARGFGSKVNADAFEQLARTIPIQVIEDCRPRLKWIEALLLGQAGLLDEGSGGKVDRSLKAVYEWIRHKHGLRPSSCQVRRLRMRPHNFPVVRLAQLAKLVHQYPDLPSLVSGTQPLSTLKQNLMVTATGNRKRRLFRCRRQGRLEKRLGSSMADHLLINVVIPLMFWRGRERPDLVERAVGWLRQTRSENNVVTCTLGQQGFGQESAFDSQAIIELKSQYCDKRRCLECAVGYSILNPMHPNPP